jgi:hypothetical protein
VQGLDGVEVVHCTCFMSVFRDYCELFDLGSMACLFTAIQLQSGVLSLSWLIS